MKIGYARVSTREQNLDMQIIALEDAGCEKIYEEIVSGVKAERPVLNNLIKQLRPDDILVVWKLDRLGRSLKHLVDLVQLLMQNKIGLCSLNDPIDTTTSQGRLVFNIFASLAEFERDIIRERTQAGLSAARARGRLGGRPRGLPKASEATACAAETLYREGKLSAMQIAKKLTIWLVEPSLGYILELDSPSKTRRAIFPQRASQSSFTSATQIPVWRTSAYGNLNQSRLCR